MTKYIIVEKKINEEMNDLKIKYTNIKNIYNKLSERNMSVMTPE